MDQDADGLIGLDLRDAGSPPATWQSEAAQDRYAFHLRVSLPPTLTGPCDLEQWFRLLALRDLPFPRRGPDPVNPEVLERYFRDVLRARDFGFTLPDETLTSLAQLWDRPPARPTTQFDARALGVRTLWIDGAPYDATAPFRIPLTPGRHSFRSDRSDAVAHFFTVADDGTIADDPALRGVASVVDRGTLVLLAGAGRTVTIDASRLWGPVIWIDGGAYDTRSAFFLSLAPGQHQFRTLSGPTYSFMVAADGTIASVDTPPGVVSGLGTRTLTVIGLGVTVDATALGGAPLWLGGDAFATTAPFVVHLLPGRHEFYRSPGTRYYFTVSDTGLITSIEAPEGVASGIGTSTLRLLLPQ